MFSWLHNTVADPVPHIRRVIDLTTPKVVPSSELRADRRYARALTVILFPWINGVADQENLILGVTQDISDSGISVLTTSEITSEESALVFVIENNDKKCLPFFKVKVVRHSLKATFNKYGLVADDYLNNSHPNLTLSLNAFLCGD